MSPCEAFANYLGGAAEVGAAVGAAEEGSVRVYRRNRGRRRGGTAGCAGAGG